ncbi:hypothetical protein WG954_12050 [Lacibacter sp. H375]|uniref:hypothetical protein n=1 Tax=Lacibacter sp. H375 TaxID=3133424 RepID=UPI0030BD6B76
MYYKSCIRKLGLLLLFISGSFSLSAQRKDVSVSQFDPRFTVSVQRYWSSLGGSEEYYFYVQNNTSEEYSMVVNVTLNLACVGTKNFTLGVNKVVWLKPNGRFTPEGDWSHIYTSGADNFKNCRLADGKSFTLLQGISYTVSNLTNVTQQKAAEEKKKADEKLATERKAAEEKKKREEKLAAEKKAAEEKKQKDAKAKAEQEKKEKEAQSKTSATTTNEGETESGNNATSSTTKGESSGTSKAEQEYNAREEAKRQEEARLKAEQEARDQRQRDYDNWKQNANEQRRQAEATAATASVSLLFIVGTWIYNDKMGRVNPDFVYNKPENKGKLKLNMSVEWGYSMSYAPVLFASDRSTMINGNTVSSKSLENKQIYTLNLDVNLKIGAEHDNYGGYAFLSPKAGFSPIFDGYQLSLLNYGARLYAGTKGVKAYGEYMAGERVFSKTDNDPEESGKGKLEMNFEKLEYGIRFTTKPNADYKRSHISLGMIMERLVPGGIGTYIHPETGSMVNVGKSPWIQGYAFQWKKDHTFNFYANYYPAYIVAGDVSYNNGAPSSELKSTPTGSFFELGFIRSIDFW